MPHSFIGLYWIHSPRSLSSSEKGKNLMIEIPSGYKIIESGVFEYADSDMPKVAEKKIQ